MENQDRPERPRSKFRYSATIYPRKAGKKTEPRIPPPSKPPELVARPMLSGQRERLIQSLEPARPIVPVEPLVDRLWRGMHEEAHGSWLDRAVQYASFWIRLDEPLGAPKDYIEIEESFSIKILVDGTDIPLSVNYGHAHHALIRFVRGRTFYLRTNLPERLITRFEARQRGDETPLELRLARQTAPSGKARAFGRERIFPITKASPPSVF